MAADSPSTPRNPTPSAPRRLLARVRDVMAGDGDTDARLDQIAGIVAGDMVAEVCSIYVRRAGDILELFATHGLKPDAVHTTRLGIGEGIVGDVAAKALPFALADVQSHPNFAYRPETGEEAFQSMAGVPILRDGRVVGVLAIQNRTQRHYDEEEIETLQTVAMVLAELVTGSAGLRKTPDADDTGDMRPLRRAGVRLNGGLAVGTAVLHRPVFRIETLVAEDPAVEHARLRQAFAEMLGALDDLLANGALEAGGEHRDVLDAYRMIAEDDGWVRRIEEAIETGLTAEAAVQRVQNDIRARLRSVDDPYLRERVHDFDDLADRLLRHLLGPDGGVGRPELPEDAIVIARSMGPAQLLDFDTSRLRGLAVEEGTPTSHVAIIARALDIPVVGRVRDLFDQVDDGDAIVVDADHAQVFVRPGPDIRDGVHETLRARAEQRAHYAEIRDLPAETRDGVTIRMGINAGLLIDVDQVAETGADGVGLFRTEIPFMVRAAFPTVDEQEEIYRRALEQADGKPLVFRTLDIGGDKVLPYWDSSEEENPAMGWRSIRISLDRPALLRQQMRALIRAAVAVDRPLDLMFPMVAEVSEFDSARALLQKELDREHRGGRALPSALRVGAMLEVPALAFQLPALLGRVDFLSVGSNDLIQFLFASDRGNPRTAERYDALSPGVLAFLAHIIDRCREAETQVTLCGEMAGRPLEAMALIGLGFESLSMASPGVGPVKEMIRGLDRRELAGFVRGVLDDPDHSLRQRLQAYAGDRGIVL